MLLDPSETLLDAVIKCSKFHLIILVGVGVLFNFDLILELKQIACGQIALRECILTLVPVLEVLVGSA